ncbi:uncharacterized protein BKCO1_19000140 [Diplodia corticola]|uniref:DUF6594 domain-containing protein n=1 Tax=Diplodia corticola TaxID=236234 RepID=A0A1J9R4F8_9PEZI|nr:uncharacterized protein BKCO1_19000140 [Diplodia corticola]OJD35114.1 hypothetical protein BKCO1_19000140 [Diplodia corticola]
MLAAFQSSDPAFSIYRSFDYLHSRVLLDLQYELSELEQELRTKDDNDATCAKGQRRLTSRKRDDVEAGKEAREDDGVRTRRQILTEIRGKLVDYDEVLIKARETATFQRPNKRDYKSVTTWFMNWKPLIKREWRSLQHQEDMLTLRQGREWAGFDGLIEKLLTRIDCKPIRWIFQPRLLSEKSKDKHVHYYDAKRVETFVAVIITFIIFILLVLPVVLMYELTSIGDRPSTFRAIGVLVVFTLLFSAAMSLLTKAKRHELFGASAAYCAVLVVFISNFNGSSDGSPTTR